MIGAFQTLTQYVWVEKRNPIYALDHNPGANLVQCFLPDPLYAGDLLDRGKRPLRFAVVDNALGGGRTDGLKGLQRFRCRSVQINAGFLCGRGRWSGLFFDSRGCRLYRPDDGVEIDRGDMPGVSATALSTASSISISISMAIGRAASTGRPGEAIR